MSNRLFSQSIPQLLVSFFCILGLTYGLTAPQEERPQNCVSGLSSYDFIIVGGGTAGLAVASRLSQKLTRGCILVIEAGEDGRAEPRIFIPGRKGSTIGTKYDWNLTTVPQPDASNRRFSMTRGKVLGGSSALNLMTWDRSSKAEFDSWEELGNPGWNWKNLYASMLKVENFTPSPEYVGTGVGTGGLIQTLINRILPVHQLSFIPTMNFLGIATNLASLNGNPMGVMRQPSNIRNSDYTRSYSTAYLEAAAPNLILLLNTRVAKINFNNNKKTTGVTLENGSVISVRKEVILSAGSLQSPGLLEISGIGSKTVLAAAGISKVVSELPGVGENLQDHFRIQSSYQLKPEFLSFDRLRYNTTFAAEQLALYNAQSPSMYDYTGSGYTYLNWSQVSTSTAASLLVLAKQAADSSCIDQKKLSFLTNPKLSAQVPQLEVIFSDGYTGVKGYPAVGTPLYGAEFFALIAAIQHPFSKGSVHINSSSIATAPIIDPNYLSNSYDLAAAVTAAKYMRKIATSEPMASVWQSEYDPGPAVSTDAQWESFARNTTLSIFHPVGTCAMMPKKDGGVVDTKLRVYGVTGLRVVDASVIPILLSAHIQTAVYGLAERAADIILSEYN